MKKQAKKAVSIIGLLLVLTLLCSCGKAPTESKPTVSEKETRSAVSSAKASSVPTSSAPTESQGEKEPSRWASDFDARAFVEERLKNAAKAPETQYQTDSLPGVTLYTLSEAEATALFADFSAQQPKPDAESEDSFPLETRLVIGEDQTEDIAFSTVTACIGNGLLITPRAAGEYQLSVYSQGIFDADEAAHLVFSGKLQAGDVLWIPSFDADPLDNMFLRMDVQNEKIGTVRKYGVLCGWSTWSDSGESVLVPYLGGSVAQAADGHFVSTDRFSALPLSQQSLKELHTNEKTVSIDPNLPEETQEALRTQLPFEIVSSLTSSNTVRIALIPKADLFKEPMAARIGNSSDLSGSNGYVYTGDYCMDVQYAGTWQPNKALVFDGTMMNRITFWMNDTVYTVQLAPSFEEEGSFHYVWFVGPAEEPF